MSVGGLRTGVVVLVCTAWAQAQQVCPNDPVIDQIRVLSTINEGDQSRIVRWVGGEIEILEGGVDDNPLASFNRFRLCLKAQYENQNNTPQFRAALAKKTAELAVDRIARGGGKGTVSHALARALVDMETAEAHAAFLAGLKSSEPVTRLLCARGLASIQDAIAAEEAKLARTVDALRSAGEVESSPEVLSQFYLALSYPSKAVVVFDAFMAVFDIRLSHRRGPAVYVDRAEIDAFDFFRKKGVIESLAQPQKVELARRLAVFLRMDAERYTAEELSFEEMDAIERRLDGAEALLELLVGRGSGGDIRGELRDGGHDRLEAVLQEAYRWVGHPTTQSGGPLNAAPWNVPIGAP